MKLKKFSTDYSKKLFSDHRGERVCEVTKQLLNREVIFGLPPTPYIQWRGSTEGNYFLTTFSRNVNIYSKNMRTKTKNRNGNVFRLFTSTILVGILAVFASMASDVNLAWDPSPTLGITNYVFYAHTNVLSNDSLADAILRMNVGTNLTMTIENISTGQWSFAVTAMRDGLESDPSNVLNVEVPKAPERMRTVVLQYSGTLSNWYDVGFFKLRLPDSE